jgi:hypothetical protein
VPTVEVLNQVVEVLGSTFEDLEAWKTIYTVPRIMWLSSSQPIEIQVADSGAGYEDHEGAVVRERFQITVGLLFRMRKDWAQRHYESLKDTTDSIHLRKVKVIAALDGNFLPTSPLNALTNLLTRPLKLLSESQVMESSKDHPGLLIKEVSFEGGLNTSWVKEW